MKAVVFTEYGPPEVLHLRDIPKPVPGDNEVFIRIRATTVTTGCCHVRKADPFIARLFFGLTRPKVQVLGYEFSGEIEAVGKAVRSFREGDAVFASTGVGYGAYAEYICLPEDGVIAPKPDALSFEEAAAIPFGGGTALFFLRDKAGIQAGQRVLINGASGSVGSAAVQIARYYGAEVTGICSGSNAGLVKSLGAGTVIDYTTQDVTQNGETYDIIFDTVGKLPFSRCRQSLSPDGVYLTTMAGPGVFARMIWTTLAGRKDFIFAVASDSKEYLVLLGELAASGRFSPVIGRTYPIEDIVEAHRYVDTGHKKGNVVISVG